MPAGSRLTPDPGPAVTVGDLMNVLEQTFKELGSRDLSGLLRLDMYAHANRLEDDGDGGCFVRKGAASLCKGSSESARMGSFSRAN